jgi:predicted Zn-dependent protease
VKARQRQAIALAGLVVGSVLAAPTAGDAQQPRGRTRDPNAPTLMVPVFRSQDKKAGVEASDRVRERLERDIPPKELWIVPKNDIIGTLKASGYPENEALAPNDARELGRLLRADEYLQANVVRNGPNVRIEPALVLVRDNSLVQPLPPVEGNNTGRLAEQIARSLRDARKQLDDERNCVNLAREGKFQEAIAAAQKGTAEYPQATLTRACALSAMVEMKAPADQLQKAAEELLAIDPRSRIGLQQAAQAYTEAAKATQDSTQRGQLQDKALETYTALLSTDPTNTRLVDAVVREIAASGRPQVALPIIQKSVEANPGDPQLLRLQWRIQLAARDNKGAIATGEQMVQLDTALADTLYFIGQSAAYAADSQPQKAAETIAKGIAKYPNDPNLQLVYAQQLRAAGQNQQALDAINKVIAANPKVERGEVLKAQILTDLNQPDSAAAALRRAAANGDSLAGPMAVAMGNQKYKAANQSKSAADFQAAISLLSFADSIAAAPETKAQAQFLSGVSALNLAQIQLNDARTKKSCSTLKEAQTNLTNAQVQIPAGGKFAPDAAAAAMGGLQQLMPYSEQLAKQMRCRK